MECSLGGHSDCWSVGMTQQRPPLWGLPAKSTTYSVTVQERHPLTGRKVQWARGPDPVMVTESAIPLSVECPRSHRGWRRDRKTNRNTAPGLVSSFQRKPATGSLQKGSYLLKKVELIPGVLKKKAALPGRQSSGRAGPAARPPPEIRASRNASGRRLSRKNCTSGRASFLPASQPSCHRRRTA